MFSWHARMRHTGAVDWEVPSSGSARCPRHHAAATMCNTHWNNWTLSVWRDNVNKSSTSAKPWQALWESRRRLWIAAMVRKAYLPGLYGKPWFVLEVIDLLPDLRQFWPDTLQVLQLFQSHLHALFSGAQLTCNQCNSRTYWPLRVILVHGSAHWSHIKNYACLVISNTFHLVQPAPVPPWPWWHCRVLPSDAETCPQR